MATEKQIAANRRNALKSTGPRTARGKAVTRFNALRHGLDAAAVIPRDANLKELAQIRRGYYRSSPHQTAAQVRLLDQMANAEWQLRYWELIETRVLNEAIEAGAGHLRQLTLMNRFSKRQARYHRAFIKAYREYQRVRVPASVS